MSLEEKIRNIPDENGWWKNSNGEKFLQLAKKLMSEGYSEDEAVAFLQEAYNAVAGEFGQ